MFGIKCLLVLLTGVIVNSRMLGDIRKVPVDIYISDAGRDAFLSKGKSIEEIASEVARKLEEKINEQVWADTTTADKRPFEFDINVDGMVPAGINLDVCGDKTDDFQGDLSVVSNDKTASSVIMFYTCDSTVYNKEFERAKQRTPLVIQRKLPRCSNDVATFVEPEPMKIEAILANALFVAAGSPLSDMVEFEDVDNGKDGFQREMRLKTSEFSMFSGAGCYFD